MDSQDQQLHDKIFKANSIDRSRNTKEIIGKLDELKPSEKAKSSQEAMSAFFQAMKGEKGDQGDEGPAGPQGSQGEKGENGKQGIQGTQGLQGEKGDQGEQGSQGESGLEGLTGKDGNKGKDGSPDTPEQIVEKLNSLKQAWIEVKNIKGLDRILGELGNNFLEQAKGFAPRTLDSLYDVAVRGTIGDGQSLIWNKAQQKWIPGSSSGSGTLASETPTGVINGSNNIFTVTSTPVFVTVNGQVMAASGVDYTYSAGTITFITPPETGSVLISFHN